MIYLFGGTLLQREIKILSSFFFFKRFGVQVRLILDDSDLYPPMSIPRCLSQDQKRNFRVQTLGANPYFKHTWFGMIYNSYIKM